jgi:hypothetical protein
MVRRDYINGRIGIEQFEAELEEILGGGIPQRLVGRMPRVAPPGLFFTERR